MASTEREPITGSRDGAPSGPVLDRATGQGVGDETHEVERYFATGRLKSAHNLPLPCI